jgi:hypothetical protein
MSEERPKAFLTQNQGGQSKTNHNLQNRQWQRPLITRELWRIGESHLEVKWSTDGEEYGTGPEQDWNLIGKKNMAYFLTPL